MGKKRGKWKEGNMDRFRQSSMEDRASRVSLMVKNTSANADVGSVPGLGRSPGGENGNPLHILAWRIPWTEEPGGLQSMWLQRVRQD